MKYFSKTFWQMSGIFLLIVVGTLAGIYFLKTFELARAIDETAVSATVGE